MFVVNSLNTNGAPLAAINCGLKVMSLSRVRLEGFNGFLLDKQNL